MKIICRRVAIASCVLLIVGASVRSAGAADAGDYREHARATFHALFDARKFVPSGGDCDTSKQRCREVLAKLRAGGFNFLAPIERSDHLSDMPTYRRIKKTCPNADFPETDIAGLRTEPTRGFALYR